MTMAPTYLRTVEGRSSTSAALESAASALDVAPDGRVVAAGRASKDVRHFGGNEGM